MNKITYLIKSLALAANNFDITGHHRKAARATQLMKKLAQANEGYYGDPDYYEVHEDGPENPFWVEKQMELENNPFVSKSEDTTDYTTLFDKLEHFLVMHGFHKTHRDKHKHTGFGEWKKFNGDVITLEPNREGGYVIHAMDGRQWDLEKFVAAIEKVPVF